MPRLLIQIAAACLFLCLPSAAQTWDTQSAELARRIAALTGPGTVALSVHNQSAIPAEQLPVIRRALVAALTAQGITLREQATDAATTVRVTLSQTSQHDLWIAEVQQGNDTRVAMLSLDTSAPQPPAADTPITLRRTLLVAQSEPILDAQLVLLPSDPAASPHLVLLSPGHLTLYRRDAAAWTRDRALDISHTHPYPRELRGHLVMEASGLKAYLPGVVCTASLQLDSLRCDDSDDPWQIGTHSAFYNASHNYFTGVLVPGLNADPEPFFSAADLASGRTVFSTVTGRFLLADGSSLRPLTGTRDWGSDLAAVHSSCGSGSQILVSAAGDAPQDSLLAVDVTGREATPVSAPLPLDGQLTALWAISMPGTPQAIAILHRQQVYEAYGVSLICN